MERGGEPAVVHDDGHSEPHFPAVVPDIGDRIVESGVDGDDRKVRSSRFIGSLEMRHLLAAGYAPRGPEFQIHGLPAVQMAQVDRVAVDGRQHDPGRRLADQRMAGAFRHLLTAACRSGIGTRPGNRAKGEHHHHCAEYHGCLSPPASLDTGAPLSLTMKTSIRAGFVRLALADIVWTSSGLS